MPEYKTTEEYVLNELKQSQDETLRLIEENLQLKEQLKTVPATEDILKSIPESITLAPLKIQLVDISVTSGYDLPELVKKGKVDGNELLQAIGDDDVLDSLCDPKLTDYGVQSNGFIKVTPRENNFIFRYFGYQYAIHGSLSYMNILCYNVHKVDQTGLGNYNTVESDYYTWDEVPNVLKKYKLKFRSNIKSYEQRIIDAINELNAQKEEAVVEEVE